MAGRDYFEALRKSMEGGIPKATYIKAIVGRVCISMIDPLTGMPTDIHLEGDPSDNKTDIDKITVTLWSDFEFEYFRRANKKLLEIGYLAPYTKEVVQEISVNEVSDDVLEEALGKPFFSVKALLDRFTAPAPVERLLRMAKDQNKSVGVVGAIEKRLSELQQTFDTET